MLNLGFFSKILFVNRVPGVYPCSTWLPTPTADRSHGGEGRFSPAFVCFSAQQTWQRNVTRWVPETRLFWSKKVEGQGHETQKEHCRRGFLHSCECWLLLVHVSFLYHIIIAAAVKSELVTCQSAAAQVLLRTVARYNLFAGFHYSWRVL